METTASRRTQAFISLLGFIWFLGSCAPPKPPLEFKGTWDILKEDGIGGQQFHSTASVTVSGSRFRIVLESDGITTVDVFDGQFWSHQTNDPQAPEQTLNIPKTDAEMESLRFWNNYVKAAGVAGGSLAGRATVLLQSQDRGLESEMTVQSWIDQDTGITLKKIFTVYSKQLEQITSKKTEECRDIHYGPVDEAVFKKL